MISNETGKRIIGRQGTDYDEAEKPTDCYEQLKADERCLLVDCRAEIEWQLLGTADLSEIGKKTLLVEWTNLANQRNPEFVNEIASYVSKDTPLIIMCRIGGRSAAAANALIEAGFSDVTNMSEGYKGGLMIKATAIALRDGALVACLGIRPSHNHI